MYVPDLFAPLHAVFHPFVAAGPLEQAAGWISYFNGSNLLRQSFLGISVIHHSAKVQYVAGAALIMS